MGNAKWNKMKKQYYRQNIVVQTDDRAIDFSPEDFNKLETNGNKIKYDEYLDIIRTTGHEVRHYFELCFYNCGAIADCKGQIERIDKTGGKVVFQRIFVSGMEMDGSTFVGKEDHVWMDIKGFEKFVKGSGLSFSLKVYRYLKAVNSKRIDYVLRNFYNNC